MNSNKFPLIPMGAITGSPDRKQLEKAIQTYAQVGFTQFLIYPRSGAEVPYMSDEWLDICEVIVMQAKKYKMDIWLYDEFNWPSGSCKGQVVASNAEHAAKCLTFSQTDSENKPAVEYVKEFPDILSIDAVKCFISLTHAKYFEKLSQYFGSVIKGFFTDEPSFFYACRKTAGEIKIPYYNGLYDDYKDVTGRCFLDDARINIADSSQNKNFWVVYNQLIGKQMRKAFCDPIATWCQQHGVHMSGHLMAESPVMNAIKYNGDIVRVLDGFTLPGIDEIHTRTEIDMAEWLTLGTVHRSVQRHKNGGLAELFALGPCDMTLSKMRQMIWLTAMFGIDHYVLAVSALDARGNALKKEYFNPMSDMQPWYEGFSLLNQDASTAASYARKSPVFDIYVRYPQNEAAQDYLQVEKPLINMQVSELLVNLVKNQWSWKIIAEDEIAETDQKPVITIQENQYIDQSQKKVFNNIPDLMQHLSIAYTRNIMAIGLHGQLIDDVFVRTFNDESYTILNLSKNPIDFKLCYHDNPGDKVYHLPAEGVCILDDDKPVWHQVKHVVTDGRNEFKLSLDRPNRLRMRFSSKSQTFEFNVVEPLLKVKLAVRSYDNNPVVYLDGKRIAATANCAGLNPGFDSLYRTSESFDLASGQHHVTIETTAQDYLYLPLCYLMGDFAVTNTLALSRLPDTVMHGSLSDRILAHYAGGLCLAGQVKIPANQRAVYLRLNPFGLFTKVWINDCYLGEKGWDDFIWEIPSQYKDKQVELKIEQYTSIGAMFGSTAIFDWTDIPRSTGFSRIIPGSYINTGLEKPIEWLLE